MLGRHATHLVLCQVSTPSLVSLDGVCVFFFFFIGGAVHVHSHLVAELRVDVFEGTLAGLFSINLSVECS